jgi:hypothetical protein
MVEIEEEEAVSAEADSAAQEKCTMQSVQIVVHKLRYHSSLLKADLFIAGNVTKNTEETEEEGSNVS